MRALITLTATYYLTVLASFGWLAYSLEQLFGGF